MSNNKHMHKTHMHTHTHTLTHTHVPVQEPSLTPVVSPVVGSVPVSASWRGVAAATAWKASSPWRACGGAWMGTGLK